jgi:hypothetical protein
MVYDGYAPFLLRNTYYLDENAPPPQTPVKKFTKYIYIKPAFAQRMVNEQKSGLKNESGDVIIDTRSTNPLTAKGPDGSWIKLGTVPQTLWNKPIKIRIISKKTGKKIDLNVKFKKTHAELDQGDNNNLC